MKKSYLIQMLRKFDMQDFKKFGRFINSPYFNSNKKISEFYKLLSEYFPDFDSPEITKEKLFRRLYKKDNVAEGTIYYLISETESLLEKFIGIENLNPLSIDLAYLSELTKLGMHNLFAAKYKSVLKKLDSIPDELYINNFLISEVRRDNSIQRSDFLTKKDLIKNEWTDPSNELLKLFIKNSLRNLVLILNYNNVVSKELDVFMLEEITQIIEKKGLVKSDIDIRVLYTEVKLMLNADEKYYKELKEILIKERRKLSSKIFSEMLVVMNNYLLRKKIATGKFDDAEIFELTEIYLDNLSKNKNEKITPDAFMQIFINGAAMNKFEWLKTYVKKYSGKLEDKYVNDALCYCNAFLFYEEREFENAMKELSKIKTYSIVFIKPIVKVLQLKLYFEMNLHSEALDLAKSFEQFLRNDKFLSELSRKSNRDFLRFYFKLLKVSLSRDKRKITDLQSEIKSHKGFLIQHKWFSRVLSEIQISGS